jgi:MFS family permease
VLAVRRWMPAMAESSVGRFDVTGFALLSLCMAALSLSLDAPLPDHRLAVAAGLLLLSLLAAFGYVLHARRHPAPLFRLGLFDEPNFTVGLVGNLVSRVGVAAVPFLLPLLLQLQLGYSPLRSGLMMVPAAAAGIVTKYWVSGLVRRHGYEKFLIWNTMVVGGAVTSLALVSPDWPLWALLLQLAVFGGANSMQFAAMNSVTLKDLSRADAGSGNSLFSMVQMLAMGLGASIGGGLVSLLSDQLSSTQTAFRLAFVVVGLLTLASALVFRRLDGTRTPKAGAATPR